MKKHIGLLITLTLLTPQGWAQGYNQQQQMPVSSAYQECDKNEMAKLKEARQQNPSAPINHCEAYYISSAITGQGLGAVDQKTTMDRQVTCVQRAGFTQDYDDCKRVLGLYNGVMLAEQAMFASQKVRMDIEDRQTNAKVTAEAQAGNLQGAAIDATVEKNKQLAKLNTEQFWTYNAAITALGAALGKWQGKKSKALEKVCAAKGPQATSKAAELGVNPVPADICMQALSTTMKDRAGEVFANEDAKGQFIILSGQFIKKALEAKARAGINTDIANKLDQPDPIEDEQDLMLEKCVLTPSAPECRKAGNRVSSGGDFKGSEFSFDGSGGANQAFDFGSESGGSIGDDDKRPAGSDMETVADVASPFQDEVKEANGILNPAAAATVTPGSAPGSSGAGSPGAGGSFGSGSASLGDDLQGAQADEKKDPEIKTGKYSAKYANKSTGTGFQAIKQSKENSNPFASLFDSKSEGGIEEDRSIASTDEDGEASGIWIKLSRKYGQVQSEKRIEASNLE